MDLWRRSSTSRAIPCLAAHTSGCRPTLDGHRSDAVSRRQSARALAASPRSVTAKAHLTADPSRLVDGSPGEPRKDDRSGTVLSLIHSFGLLDLETGSSVRVNSWLIEWFQRD